MNNDEYATIIIYNYWWKNSGLFWLMNIDLSFFRTELKTTRWIFGFLETQLFRSWSDDEGPGDQLFSDHLSLTWSCIDSHWLCIWACLKIRYPQMYRLIINFPYEHCNLMQFLGHVRDISQSFSTTPSSTSKSARAHCLEALNVGRPAIAPGSEFWMCHGHQNWAEGWNGFCPKMMHRFIQCSRGRMAVQDVSTFNQGFFWLLSHFPRIFDKAKP